MAGFENLGGDHAVGGDGQSPKDELRTSKIVESSVAVSQNSECYGRIAGIYIICFDSNPLDRGLHLDVEALGVFRPFFAFGSGFTAGQKRSDACGCAQDKNLVPAVCHTQGNDVQPVLFATQA